MSTRSASFWKRTGLTVGGFVVVAAVCSQIYLSREADKIEAQAVDMQAIKNMVPPNRTYAATIIGATGAVGGEVLKELLKSPRCAHVTSLGRRKKDEFDSLEGAEKLTQLVIDFDDIEKEVELLKEHEVAFITLGVGAPSKTTLDEVYKVDVEYSAAFARACKRAGVRHISLLSSVGTPSNGRKYSEGKPPGTTAVAGSAAYMMIKSMIQDAILQLEFDRASMFQPSLLATKESRFGIGDSIMQTVFPKISWLLPTPFREVTVEDLGRAMRINAEWGLEKKGYEILTREQFTELLALEKEKDNGI